VCAVDQFDIGIDVVAQPVDAAGQRFIVRGARRELQLAVTLEIAGYRLLDDNAGHGVDGGVIGAIPAAGALATDPTGQDRVIDS
jgi:hypothetical protein